MARNLILSTMLVLFSVSIISLTLIENTQGECGTCEETQITGEVFCVFKIDPNRVVRPSEPDTEIVNIVGSVFFISSFPAAQGNDIGIPRMIKRLVPVEMTVVRNGDSTGTSWDLKSITDARGSFHFKITITNNTKIGVYSVSVDCEYGSCYYWIEANPEFSVIEPESTEEEVSDSEPDSKPEPKSTPEPEPTFELETPQSHPTIPGPNAGEDPYSYEIILPIVFVGTTVVAGVGYGLYVRRRKMHGDFIWHPSGRRGKKQSGLKDLRGKPKSKPKKSKH